MSPFRSSMWSLRGGVRSFKVGGGGGGGTEYILTIGFYVFSLAYDLLCILETSYKACIPPITSKQVYVYVIMHCQASKI